MLIFIYLNIRIIDIMLKVNFYMKRLFFSLFFIMLFFQNVYGEEFILISRSPAMENIILDGKWSSNTEWKESVYTGIPFDENKYVHLRTAHHENFIYFLLDFESDIYPDTNMDKAMICLNSDNDKSLRSDSDDYCFIVVLNGKSSHVIVGGSNNAINGNFQKIENDFQFIGIGTASDSNDRYSKIPHSSYEFKIPTKLVGRSDTYGFYFSLYDYDQNKLYSWPNVETKNNFLIPSPSMWGTLISPDKSLPEFSFSIIFFIMFPLLAGIFMLTKSKFFRIISY